MANNSANVTTGKPVKTGAIFMAPVGTTLPTDASSTLNSAFVHLGYASEDGVTNNNSPDNEAIKAWGGDVVLNTQTEKPDEFTFTLIEAMNANVLKMVYGDSNVTVTEATSSVGEQIAIAANSGEQVERAFVFDMLLKGNALKRIVIPKGKVTELGDITLASGNLAARQCTIKCMVGKDGYSIREYLQSTETTAS